MLLLFAVVRFVVFYFCVSFEIWLTGWFGFTFSAVFGFYGWGCFMFTFDIWVVGVGFGGVFGNLICARWKFSLPLSLWIWD